MNQFKPINQRHFWLLMLFAIFGCVPTFAQALDFSRLKDDSPQDGLSMREKYFEALKNNEWVNVCNYPRVAKWQSNSWQNDNFNMSLLVTQVKKLSEEYAAYLVSPALNLSKVAGQSLNFMWRASSAKGEGKLQVAIINKDGSIAKEIGDVLAVPRQSQYEAKTFTIPSDLLGVGFLAFIAKGNYENRASFYLQNIEIGAQVANTTIKALPSELNFGTVKVGDMGIPQDVSVQFENYSGDAITPIVEGDAADFEIPTTAIPATGSEFKVNFKPTSAGEKHATIVFNADGATAKVELFGVAEDDAPVVVDKPTVELLHDGLFYEFDGNKPKTWETKGVTKKLEGADRYSNDAGFALGLTTDNEMGYVKQVIDLKAPEKEVVAGNELECLVFYSTAKSAKPEGPFHLALRWLNDANEEVISKEKDFINNDKVFFGRMKAYGRLKFRTTCPKGATKLEFKIEVAPNSQVRLDDMSVTRLAKKDQTKLIAILPQYRTITGEVGVEQKIPVAIQTAHLAAPTKPKFNGTNSDQVLSLDVPEIGKNASIVTNLNVKPTKKGAYVDARGYSVKFEGAELENTGSLSLMAYVMAQGKKPTIKIKEGEAVREMTAEPKKTDAQVLNFEINDVITSVTLGLYQQVNGAFRINPNLYYYAQSKESLYSRPLTITFAPKEAGEYTATLWVETALADTLKIQLKGVCKANNGDVIAEKFTEIQPMDKRFKGKASWNNYNKYDLGYWKLDGKWNSKSNVTLNKKGVLYFDEILPNGVNTIKMTPATSAAACDVEYSIDGGGHWKSLGKANANGEMSINTHRPTFVRFVNNGETDLEVNTIEITPNKIETRETFNDIQSAMLMNADAQPLTLLNETFSNLRHTRALGLTNWQNLTLRGERPFYAWEQKDKKQEKVENEVAQICFLNYGTTDPREHESWLISPTISYQKAASKILTFSLRYANATSDGKEQFGFYIITEKDGKAVDQFINLNDYAPAGVKVEDENWYNYRLDLAKIDSVQIDDNFHIAFSFYSPQGGSATSLNFMIDNLTFGRTDLPELEVDKKFIHFAFQAGLKSADQTFKVTTKNAIDPVTITLVPKVMNRYFTFAPNVLPKDGGEAIFNYKSDEKTQRAAMFLVQTPGAEPAIVKVLATIVTGINDVESAEAVVAPRITASGIEMGGTYKSYSIYSATGQLLKQGGNESTISTANLTKGVIILKVVCGNGVKTFTLCNK